MSEAKRLTPRFPIVHWAGRELARRTGLYRNYFYSNYRFMHYPDQLIELMQLYKSVAAVPGSYAEVGCAYGATTVLMKKYSDRLGLDRRFIAMDTFDGFVKEHADHDISVLKRKSDLRTAFTLNSEEWLRETLAVDEVEGVEIVKGDATTFDFSTVAPIAYCLIDVDLYKPIADILPKVYEALAPGGIIVIDDCAPHEHWEGALVAYREFAEARGFEPQIACDKFGLIKKGAVADFGATV